MNRERAKELLPVIQAFAEGKAVQWRPSSAHVWSDEVKAQFEWLDHYQYRIKPEPRLVNYTAEEFIPFIGEKFRHKIDGDVAMLLRVSTSQRECPISFGNGWLSIDTFSKQWEHYDGPGKPGRPIGKVVE